MPFAEMDKYGRLVYYPDDVNEMSAPYRCMRCHKVHDAGHAEVVGQYADCTMWKCPNCGATIDDRPIGWGGSAEKIRRE